MNSPQFKIGDEVFIISQPDAVGVIIKEPKKIAGDWWYCISFGARRRDCPEGSLEKFTGGHDVMSLLEQNSFGPRESLSKVITFTKLKQPLQNNLYAYRASRTEFHEYQFKPLVKLLNSTNQRLLIADEVGLGKTIEAGFIYQELHARHNLDRVLVVCPSALRFKWSEEMLRRFGEEFEILDSRGFKRFLNRINSHGPYIKLRGICSLQSLRSEGLLELLENISPPLDLVIIDEAHHMRNSATLSNRLGKVLNELAETMLLLTATPIHLGNENLFQLLQILDPEEFDNFFVFDQMIEANRPIIEADRIIRAGKSVNLKKCLEVLKLVEMGSMKDRFIQSPIYKEVLEKVMNSDGSDRTAMIEIQRGIAQLNLLGHIISRTRKREVAENQPKRQAGVMPVRWSAEEQNLYDTVTDYCRERIVETRAHLGVASWFPVITLQRQIASCIPAALQHYLGQSDNNTYRLNGPENSDIEIEDLTEDDFEDSEFPSLRDDPGLHSILQNASRYIQKDSKIDQLLEQLKTLDKAEPNRKILLFSYFKKTLGYLHSKLQAAGYTCVLVTGDIPSRPTEPDKDERGRRLLQFKNDPSVRILLSSEVGSEGLDFQFAHILINYDLPWNPMLVEQRIGRLDRLGQKSDRILIYNFSIPGTIEERILQRLYSRIRIFEESIGDLESILGTEIRQLTIDLLTSKLTPVEQEQRIEDCASIIERRRQELVILEKQAVQFIGHDAYFMQELEQIKKNKRYITSEELETLISDFISKEFPVSTWKRDTEDNCFRFKIDKELAVFMRNLKPLEHSDAFFIDRAYRKPVLVTCNAGFAFGNEEVELITSQHKLIQAIVNYYELHPDRLHPVSCVEIHTDIHDIEVGDYAYFLYLIEQQSARPGKTLEAVFVSIPKFLELPKDKSEILLSQMVTSSKTLNPVDLNIELASKLHDNATDIIGDRISDLKKSLEKTNEDVITRRLTSLEATYRSKREKIVLRLKKAKDEEKQPQYIRMLEGTIRNLDTRYEDKYMQIDAGRRVDLQLELFAAGIVRIYPNAEL